MLSTLNQQTQIVFLTLVCGYDLIIFLLIFLERSYNHKLLFPENIWGVFITAYNKNFKRMLNKGCF